MTTRLIRNTVSLAALLAHAAESAIATPVAAPTQTVALAGTDSCARLRAVGVALSCA